MADTTAINNFSIANIIPAYKDPHRPSTPLIVERLHEVHWDTLPGRGIEQPQLVCECTIWSGAEVGSNLQKDRGTNHGTAFEKGY